MSGHLSALESFKKSSGYVEAEYQEECNMDGEGNHVPEYSHCHVCGEKIDGDSNMIFNRTCHPSCAETWLDKNY